MQDMLVHLLNLPDISDLIRNLEEKEHIQIFKALPPDKTQIVRWASEHFSSSGGDEVDVSFKNTPPSTYVAVHDGEIIGFASYNTTAPDFFGPTKVDERFQGKGVGKALLIKALQALREEGYVYAIIGGVGPVKFYEKCVGAQLIPDSDPGVYRYFIRTMKKQVE